MNEGEGSRKLITGIPGFDEIALGGLPRGRSTLLVGAAGSGKSVFCAQFLAEGIRQMDEAGVFVTFEETAVDIRWNLDGFGWDIQGWEQDGYWAFVDASPDPAIERVMVGEFDLGPLLLRVKSAIEKTGARRVVIDSVSAIFSQFEDATVVRRELLRIGTVLKELGVTLIMTAERAPGFDSMARFGVEEYVVDNVIALRNELEANQRRRTIELLKFRGVDHQKGEFPYTIRSGEGIVIVPLSGIALTHTSSTQRISSGNQTLDEMCGGGFFRDSIILASGATGTGKTLLTTQFLAGGVAAGERCLLFAFEESRQQLFRNAQGWGIDLETMERDDKLRIVCNYPETEGLEDHLITIKNAIESFKPDRIAIDSLTALERVASIRAFSQFVIALTAYVKQYNTAVLVTATTQSLFGGSSVTENHISTMTDAILLLRYIEAEGEIQRALGVLKMRGSMHDKSLRQLTIDGSGMHIGKPYGNIRGVLSGHRASVPEAN